MKKDIAILIPCYNSEKTIVETLLSLKEQISGLDRVAYIVIADDKSPDNTVKVATEYWAGNTPPLKLERRNANHGEYLNVNMAIEGMESSIEWFIIMHGDNMATPNYLQLLLKHIDKADSKTALICGSWKDFDETGSLNEGDNRYEAQGSIMINGTKQAVRDTLFLGCWWHISCTAIRISSFKTVGGLPRGMRQKGDYEFLLRILENGFNVEYLPIPLMLYRSHEASISSKNFKIHRDLVETLMTIRNYIHSLSFVEVIRLYGIIQYQLLRRFASSLLKMQGERALKAVNVSFLNLKEGLIGMRQVLTKNYSRHQLVNFKNALPENEEPTTNK
jgi:glycosyltransferase involved in cell wall biosynthesis